MSYYLLSLDHQHENAVPPPEAGSEQRGTENKAEDVNSRIGRRQADPTLVKLDSNQVYYKSRARQVHVFPECNTSTVEVSLS